MRTCVGAAAAVATAALLCAWPVGATSGPDPSGALSHLRGVWKAPTYRVVLGSLLDREVYGPDATFVRDVTLTLMRNGTGLAAIYTSVVDNRGRTVRPSASVIEVHLEVGDRTEAPPHAMRVLRVLRAQERYIYEAEKPRTLKDVTVSIREVDANPSLLFFRYDTWRGVGSFGDTLHRRAR